MVQQTQRIQALDYLRGFAVIVMVIGHSIDSVLSPAARATELFRFYDGIRGFTAPLFLFVSGFTFAVVALRRWDAYVAFGAPARRRLTKMIMLLGLGYALHFPFFSLNKLLYDTRPQEYAMMVQVDILHCLAVSILMLMAFIVVARTPGRFVALTAGAATLVVLATPLVWLVDLSGVVTPFLAPYFNQNVPSIFPLFPFGAYLFTGAVLGTAYVQARQRKRDASLLQKMFIAGLAASVFGILLDLQPVVLYPSHDFWKTSPNFFLIRIGIVAAVTSLVFRIRRVPPRLADALVLLGRSSLIVYAVHLVVVYGSAANPGLAQIIGPQLPPIGAITVAAGVLMVMVTMVYARETLREHHYYPLRLLQAGFTSAMLYFFLTKPY